MVYLISLLMLAWIACAFLAMIAADAKRAAVAGLWLGFLFGPLGLIAALGLDRRYQCSKCFGRINRGPQVNQPAVCQHCGAPLVWVLKNGRLETETPGDRSRPYSQQSA